MTESHDYRLSHKYWRTVSALKSFCLATSGEIPALRRHFHSFTRRKEIIEILSNIEKKVSSDGSPSFECMKCTEFDS